MSTLSPALVDEARAWLADDPNPETQRQLQELVDAAVTGNAGAAAELQESFSGLLQFGTAGLRGRMGPGPSRMNTSVVSLAAAGIGVFLTDKVGAARVVIGFDARHRSREFAVLSAQILTAAGHEVMLMPAPWPTPITAFAVRHCHADAGIQVTASHNPAADNGYKVYLGGRAASGDGNGVQIVPPADAEIAAAISAVGPVRQIPRAETGWAVLSSDLISEYVQAIQDVLVAGAPRELSIVHTSMHGVGHATMMAALSLAGFRTVHTVSEQADPDPEFPTVAFPNPEEPGAIDRALAKANQVGADLVVANDPDADRCAVAVHDPRAGTWRMLNGDELGALLGFYLLSVKGVQGTVANSIVSSRWLGAIAAGAGVPAAQTLTGFKWIARTPNLVYGYEEAIGFCVLPEVVRDKDGISAALAAAQLAAIVKADGGSLIDLLDQLARQHDLFMTSQVSIRVEDLSLIGAMMQRLRANPPAELNGSAVSVTDLSQGSERTTGLPPTDGIVLLAEDGTRVIVRPSGTEPKLKCYLEVVQRLDPTASREDVTAARQRGAAALERAAEQMRTVLGA